MSLMRKHAAFTLVELLAVVAVLGVLATFLLPALGSVRMHASSSVSGSNLRQIYTAMYLYANDHGGALPGPVYSGQGPRFDTRSNVSLSAKLEPYLNAEYQSERYGYSKIFAYPAWEENTPDPTGPSYQVLRSPLEDKSLAPLGVNTSAPNNIRGPMSVYELAAHELAGRHWIYEIDQQHPWVAGAGWASRLPPNPVHGDHRNVLMVDGAVIAVSLEEF